LEGFKRFSAISYQRCKNRKDISGYRIWANSFFYDKATGQPVDSAKEVIQIGPLVLARDVKTRPLESPEHALDPKKRKKGEPDYFKSGGSVERVYNDNRTYK
jgi:hypothetical protein